MFILGRVTKRTPEHGLDPPQNYTAKRSDGVLYVVFSTFGDLEHLRGDFRGSEALSAASTLSGACS